MRVISSILQRAVYPALGKVGYFHLRVPGATSVITYHGVLPEKYVSGDTFLDGALLSLAAFRAQLRLLKRHYQVISPDLFLSWLRGVEELPARSVLLTCDDGLLNNTQIMLPILQEEALQCLFFVTGGSVADSPGMLWYIELYLMLMRALRSQEPFDWRGMPIPRIPETRREKRMCWLNLMKVLSRLDAAARRDLLEEAAERWGLDRAWKQSYLEEPLLQSRFQLLRPSEVRCLSDAGMTIGAHTIGHPVLSEAPAELAHAEITDCRQALQRDLAQEVWAIAYPFGDPTSVGDREYRFAEAAGYECGFVNVGGSIGESDSRFSLPRIHVTAEMSLPEYEAHISGFHNRLQRRFRRAKVRA
jgi:peptidoglycan/xylan/chitin deacetylase (PgdA/CDA1 family)